MSGSPFSNGDIFAGASFAAVYPPSGIRVYFQDLASNVREARWQNNGWTGGTSKDILFQAKPGSPLTAWTARNKIRVYYIDVNGAIQEHCTDNLGAIWFRGIFGDSQKTPPAPETCLASAAWYFGNGEHDVMARIYYQTATGAIIEYGWSPGAWKPGPIIATGLMGTSLAVPQSSNGTLISVYYQDTTGWLQMREWTNNWGTGDILSVEAPPRTPLAVIAWDNEVRLYYRSFSNQIVQLSRSGQAWLPRADRIASCLPNSMVAAALVPNQQAPQVYSQSTERQLQELEWTSAGWVIGGFVPTA